jgi:serine/threonine protein phosphatase PrpC
MPKVGNEDNEQEDAFLIDPQKGKFVVSDGASSGIYSKLWADLLTKNFIEGEEILDNNSDPKKFLESIVNKSRIDWKAKIPADIKWPASEKILEGSFATFLALQLHDGPNNSSNWNAIAVGDSCLFKIKGKRIIQSFPIHEALDFNNSPYLIASNFNSYQEHIQITSGTFVKGEKLVLATDSISKWLFQENESDVSLSKTLDFISKIEDKRKYFENLVNTKIVHYDDLTLVMLNYF